MSTGSIPQFDAAGYKRGTREQWQNAAAAWHRWGQQLEEWLGRPTEVMLDLAGVTAGSNVLDVAAGGGGQTMAAAKRFGPSGAVLATDISLAILEYAADEAKRSGPSNVSTREMNGERLEVEPEAYDAVISRVGLIYFPDQQAALTGMHRALKQGGKVSAIVYSTPDRTDSSQCQSRSSAAARTCRHRRRGSQDRSASAPPVCGSRLMKQLGSATSRYA